MKHTAKDGRAAVSILALLLALCAGLAPRHATASGPDSDNDGMSDGYELFFWLNPTNAADAAVDSDGDTLANVAEAALWTDPRCQDTDGDAFLDNVDGSPVSRARMAFGNPAFSRANGIFECGEQAHVQCACSSGGLCFRGIV